MLDREDRPGAGGLDDADQLDRDHDDRPAHAEQSDQHPVVVQRALHRLDAAAAHPGSRGEDRRRRVGGVQGDHAAGGVDSARASGAGGESVAQAQARPPLRDPYPPHRARSVLSTAAPVLRSGRPTGCITAMRAVATRPDRHELALLDLPEPALRAPTDARARVLEVGVCGTDREIAAFEYGTAPDGADHLVIGHECLAEVLEVGPGVEGLVPGDLVVPMVRRPCTVAACAPCRRGRADCCTTGAYRERGIKEAHGFLAERIVEDRRWLLSVPAALRDVAVLVEPLTIAEKALSQVRAVQGRLPAERRGGTALVLGAGPVGLLGAMALAVEGFDTTLCNRSPAPNDKSRLAGRLGIPYVSSKETSVAELRDRMGPVDLMYEATGVAAAAFDVLPVLGPNGVCVLTGVPGPEPERPLDLAGLMRRMVLGNQVLLGTVNAGHGDFDAAIAHLGAFRDRWGAAVASIITGRHPLEAYDDLLRGHPTGIKDVVAVSG